MTSPTDGIFLVDKTEGISSHDVVSKVKKALKLDKVGHAGTLDPFATGLLIILTEQGTKLSPFVMQTDKVYVATMRLGVETDTLDRTGRIVQESKVPDVSRVFIQEAAGRFTGEIEQTPPVFSAVKCHGTRAYKLARTGRKVVLAKRRVFVHSFRILEVALPHVTMEIRCSSGTYIRSLAFDLGRAIGTGAHLSSLRRLSVGAFHIRDAVSCDEISIDHGIELWADRRISLRDALPEMKEIIAPNDIGTKIRQGNQAVLKELPNGLDLASGDGEYLKIISNDELVAVVKVNRSGRNGHGGLEIARVFN